MTYAKKTLSEIKLIHGDYGNFIKGQKLPKDKEKNIRHLLIKILLRLMR